MSEIKNDIKNHPDLKSLINESPHQTQIVVKESAAMIKHLHKQIMAALEKNPGNMILNLLNNNNKQTISSKADINQRFDTQIHILDDLKNMINLDKHT